MKMAKRVLKSHAKKMAAPEPANAPIVGAQPGETAAVKHTGDWRTPCPVCGATHWSIKTYLRKHAEKPYTSPAALAFLEQHKAAVGE